MRAFAAVRSPCSLQQVRAPRWCRSPSRSVWVGGAPSPPQEEICRLLWEQTTPSPIRSQLSPAPGSKRHWAPFLLVADYVLSCSFQPRAISSAWEGPSQAPPSLPCSQTRDQSMLAQAQTLRELDDPTHATPLAPLDTWRKLESDRRDLQSHKARSVGPVQSPGGLPVPHAGCPLRQCHPTPCQVTRGSQSGKH